MYVYFFKYEELVDVPDSNYFLGNRLQCSHFQTLLTA